MRVRRSVGVQSVEIASMADAQAWVHGEEDLLSAVLSAECGCAVPVRARCAQALPVDAQD